MVSSVHSIDLSDYENRKAEIGAQLLQMSSSVGFFNITGHGLPQEQIDLAFSYGKQFFTSPDSIKAKSLWNPDYYLGWRGISETQQVTGTSLWEWVSVGYTGPAGNEAARRLHPSDADFPGFEAWTQSFMDAVHRVALRILGALALAMGLEEDHFVEALDNTADDNGAKGLEICPGREAQADTRLADTDLTGAWAGVSSDLTNWQCWEPLEGAIIVNIGDILMRWSDDRLKSTMHRVRAPGEGIPMTERQSVAYFTMPRRSAVVQGPLKKYPPITAGEIISKEGNAYEKKKGDVEWQKIAYKKDGGPAVAPNAAVEAAA